MSNDIIAASLGLGPSVIDDPDIEYRVVDDADLEAEKEAEKASTDTVTKDVETVRENFNTVITEATDAIKELFVIAKQSENIKAFEAAATLMKSIVDANKGLIDASKEKRAVLKELKGINPAPTSVTTNNIVQLSTTEFIRQLRLKKEAEENGTE